MIYTFAHKRIRKCDDCPMFQELMLHDGECRIVGLFLNAGDIMKEKPSWCPLMEEKRKTKKKGAKSA